MIDIRKQVVELLEYAANGITDEIVYFYPPQQVTSPVVTYYEAEHRTDILLNGDEFLEEIIYQVDVWCQEVPIADELTRRISEKFVECGFVRQTCYDIQDENCIHKTMRFRGRLSPELIVYQ